MKCSGTAFLEGVRKSWHFVQKSRDSDVFARHFQQALVLTTEACMTEVASRQLIERGTDIIPYVKP